MADLVIRRPSLLHPSHERIVAPPWTSTGRSSEDNLRQGLVGAWSPAATGPTGYTLYDLSGKGNHGALTNMDLTPASGWAGANVNGKPVTALSFDGVNDLVTVGNKASHNFGTGPFSIAAWIRSTATSSTDQTIFTKDDVSVSPRIFYGLKINDIGDPTNANQILVIAYNAGVLDIAFGPAIAADNKIHHVVGLRDGAKMRIFVDGILYESVTDNKINTTNTNVPAYIGAAKDGLNLTTLFKGTIHETCLYNRALSPSEVRQLYQLGPGWLARPKQRASVLTVGAEAQSSFTASGAVTTGAATASGSATHTTPTYTGTSAVMAGAATCNGSATFTAPTYTAASSVTIAAATCSATGTFVTPVYTATSVLTVGAATASGAATFVVPVYTASASVAVGATVVNVAGSVVSPTFTGTAAVSVGAAVASGTALFGSNKFVCGVVSLSKTITGRVSMTKRYTSKTRLVTC